MAALCVQISDIVADLISGADLNQDVFVERQWVATEHREFMTENDPAHIIVFPRTLHVSAIDLKPRNAFDWDIGVWISKTVKSTVESCDPVAEILEQIVSLLVENRNFLIGLQRMQCIGVSPDPAYDTFQLLDVRVFRCVFVATYRVIQ